jgi:hypothetical protein
MNSIFVATGAGGRREADFVVDGATGDEPWGRQTLFSTIPIGAVHEMNVMSRAFSAEFGWTSSAAVNIVTKIGNQRRARGSAGPRTAGRTAARHLAGGPAVSALRADLRPAHGEWRRRAPRVA